MREIATVQWPVVMHRHDDGQVVSVRFRGGSAIDGQTTDCTGCMTRFTYRKPQAAPPAAGGVAPDRSGGLSHF